MKTINMKLALLILLNATFAQAADLPPEALQGEAAQAALHDYEARIQKDPKDAAALKAAGIILHQLNRAHADPEQVGKAEGYLKKANTLQTGDPETVAWLGSVTTMKALFETDPGKQSFYVKSGTRLMDKAVKSAPDNLIVRLTRAYNSLELPAFLQRTKFAVEDFKHYLQLCAAQACPKAAVDDAADKLAAAEKIVADNL